MLEDHGVTGLGLELLSDLTSPRAVFERLAGPHSTKEHLPERVSAPLWLRKSSCQPQTSDARADCQGVIAFRTSLAEVRPGDDAVTVIGPACLLDFIINRHLPCHALRCGC